MNWVVLQPVSLIRRIKADVILVECVKLDDEAPILKARGMVLHRFIERNSHEAPFTSVLIVNGVRDEKQTVTTPNDGGDELAKRGNRGHTARRGGRRWPGVEDWNLIDMITSLEAVAFEGTAPGVRPKFVIQFRKRGEVKVGDGADRSEIGRGGLERGRRKKAVETRVFEGS